MTDTPWTPGPWSEAAFRDIVNESENPADARLLAAAPEMAELLEQVEDIGCYDCQEFALDDAGPGEGRWWRDHDCVRLKARTLLSRIRGETETHDSVGGTHDPNTCHACR